MVVAGERLTYHLCTGAAARAEYLDAERALGRVASGADTAAVAALLVGACFQQGFLLYFAEGADTPDPPESRARDLVRPLLPTLLP